MTSTLATNSPFAMFGYSNKPPQSKWISPRELPQRILLSFVPSMRRTPVDVLGPLLAMSTLTLLLYFGQAHKNSNAAPSVSPAAAMLLYATCMPVLTFLLVRLGQGKLSLTEALAMAGYGLFGHVLTLLASLALNDEESNAVFFCCMAVVGGLSALRVAMTLMAVIPRPAARLVICSVVATLQVLSLVFAHFMYMHSTFRYAHKL